MFKRFFIVFISSLLFFSCDFFKKKEYSDEEILNDSIDYKSVDAFPLLPECESIVSREDQKICFQIKLSENIKASLSSYEIITSKKINDTILVKLKIDNTGKVTLSNIKSSDFIYNQIPKLDSLIAVGIKSLPQLEPAIKQDIPVAIEFTLPIVVRN